MNLCKKYFEGRIDIAIAFLFGSAASGKVLKEGDVDIGVYFWLENDIYWKVYQSVGEKRLAVERWVECLINATSDSFRDLSTFLGICKKGN